VPQADDRVSVTRLFVAAWPPPDLAARLGRLCPSGEAGVRPVPVEHLHVTVRFLGDVDRDEAVELLTGAALPRAVAVVGPTVHRFSGGQLVVPVTGVDPLARVVDDATRDIVSPRRRDFFGHITLARAKHGASSEIEGVSASAEFPVDRVRLVESLLDPAGSVYTTVAELALS
jgi:2'-5' RNA ligase